MGLIKVLGIKLYAYHGCMIEESKIGSDYEVDVVLNSDITLASKSDSLEDTIDYVAVNRIVTEEMAVRSKLLEHVVWRIIHRMTECYPEIILLEVKSNSQLLELYLKFFFIQLDIIFCVFVFDDFKSKLKNQ